MPTRPTTPMSDHSHSDGVRKRVCKACDRCRLKKSKCDGSNPCSRCRADNAVCVFGERKKPHDKVYPKGYVEMLLEQQSWLVHGLRELYRRSVEGEGWSGDLLKPETNGHPLTHDILTRLGVLDRSKGEYFGETTDHTLRQSSSHDTLEPHSPLTYSSFSSDTLSHREMPPTPPDVNTSPSFRMQIKTEKAQSPHYELLSQSAPDPFGSQGIQQWPTNDFSLFENSGLFDDMDMMMSADYTNLSFDNDVPSMFNSQALMDSTAFSEHEDFKQFLNTNPREIPSI